MYKKYSRNLLLQKMVVISDQQAEIAELKNVNKTLQTELKELKTSSQKENEVIIKRLEILKGKN